MDLEEANRRVNERVQAMTGEEDGGPVERDSAARLLTIGLEIEPDELDALVEMMTRTAVHAIVNFNSPVQPTIRGQIQQAILVGYMVGEEAGRA